MHLRHRLYDSDRLQQVRNDATVGTGRRGRVVSPARSPTADAEPSQQPQRSAARVRPKLVARTAADRHSVVDELDRLGVDRRQWVAVPPMKQGGGGRCSRLRCDDVAVQPNGRLRCGEGLEFVFSLVLGVHRQKPQNEQVHGGAEHGEADQNEDEAEDEVLWPPQNVFVALQRHVVAETDGRQRDDAVVDGVEVGPRLVTAEHPRAAGHHQAGHVHTDDDEVRLRHLSRPHTSQSGRTTTAETNSVLGFRHGLREAKPPKNVLARTAEHIGQESEGEIVRNFRILIVSAVKICKRCP